MRRCATIATVIPACAATAMPLRRPLPAALLAAALALTVAPAVRAEDHDDHERARAALRAGRILPLEDILARAGAEFPGDVLDVELEDEHGRFVYEVKTITTDGRVWKLEYDAATGALLRSRGRSRHHGER